MSKRSKTDTGTSDGERVPFRKVEFGINYDEKFLRLSRPQPNAQSLWLYLLTGKRTTMLPGLVIATQAVIADDFKWPLDATRDAIQEVIAADMLDADWDAGVIVLRNALVDSIGRPRDTNKPTSINQLRGWSKQFRYTPECPIKYEYLSRLEVMTNTMGDAWVLAFRDAFADAIADASRQPSPIQKAESRKQKELDLVLPARVNENKFSSPRYQLISEAWKLGLRTHLELRPNIDPTSRPWLSLPVGEGGRALGLLADELLAIHDTVEAAMGVVRNAIAVAAAEARKQKTLRWFISTRVWESKSFWKNAEQTVEQVSASPRLPRVTGSVGRVEPKSADEYPDGDQKL